MDTWNFSTRQIHGFEQEEGHVRPLAMPIYQTSTFYFDEAAQGARLFAGEENGYFYTRIDNPNNRVLAQRIADLEGAEAGVVFSSGMGAVTGLIWTLVSAGDHIVADKTLYGCTFEYFKMGLPRFGIEVEFIDMAEEGALEKALRKETKVVYFETPANPNLKVLDIRKICQAAHSYNPEIQVIIDNTFATPYLQRPIEMGADIVLHSATKYLNGHGDVIAGAVCGKKEIMDRVLVDGLRYLNGACLGPFEAYLILRGLKTLDIRMERHCENAMRVAQFLASDPRVKQVYYPGLGSHPEYCLAKKQMRLPGAIIAFEVEGDKETCRTFIDAVKLCKRAVSLGDAETLIQHPATMTHSTYSPEDLAEAGISETLIRLSVGLEAAEDIIHDLDEALGAAFRR